MLVSNGTRIVILTDKVLAMYSARPGVPCSTVLSHVPNTAHLLNQPEKTVLPRGGGQAVNTFLTPTVAHFMP